MRANEDGSVGPIQFPNVKWEFNQKSFGRFLIVFIRLICVNRMGSFTTFSIL